MPESLALLALAETSGELALAAGMEGSFVAASAAGGIFSSLSIGSVVTSLASNLVLGGISRALQKSPDSGNSDAGAAAAAVGRTITVQQAIGSRQIIIGRVRVGGQITYRELTGDNAYYHLVITFAGHVCQEIESIQFGDEEVPLDGSGNATGRFAGYVGVIKSLGDEAGQPFPQLVAASAGKWTDAHRQSGCTKIYVRLLFSQDLFPSGIPNITAVIKGHKWYDPRSALTAYTANPALVTSGYLCDSKFGFGSTYADEIDEDALIAAANICDEDVTLAAATTENRYECHGAFLASRAPGDVVTDLVNAMAGKAALIGATWRIIAGAYIAPSVSIDEGDLAGAIGQIQTLTSRRESCNGVRGTCVFPAKSWQPSDFPAVASDTYMEQDGGVRVWKDIDLTQFVISQTQAQRLAKIDLLRIRNGLTIGTLPVKLAGFQEQAGGTIAVSIDKYGFDEKVFEITNGTFSVAGDGALTYTMALRETGAAVYDWTTDEESELDAVPLTSLGDPFQVGVPGDPMITESLYETTGSAGAKARATVTWGAAADAFISRYVLEYKADNDPDVNYVKRPAVTGLSDVLDDLTPGSYDFRVQAVNFAGRRSSYSTVVTKEIVGLIAPPSDPTAIWVLMVSGIAEGHWDVTPDLDVFQGGQAQWRHSPLTTGANWNDGIVVGNFAGSATRGNMPLRTGTYMMKFVDSSDHWSANALSFVMTEGMITGLSTIGSLTEDTAFTGTKTNCAVVSSKLQLSSGELFDSHAGNFDTQAGDFDEYGGQETTGTYESSTYIDCTTVATRRWEATIKASAIVNGDNFDAHQGMFDEQDGLFDGDTSAVNDCNVETFIYTTNDNPTGSPTALWSNPIPFHVGEFNCRAAKFRAVLTAGTPSHNIQISQLRFAAKA